MKNGSQIAKSAQAARFTCLDQSHRRVVGQRRLPEQTKPDPTDRDRVETVMVGEVNPRPISSGHEVLHRQTGSKVAEGLGGEIQPGRPVREPEDDHVGDQEGRESATKPSSFGHA